MEFKILNILLADDDMDDCMFFTKALNELSLNANLNIVHDGDQLMSYLSKHKENLPQVIFLDINMPRKSGLECLSEIKKDHHLKHLPVVMFSTSNSWETITNLFQGGSHVYIHKPSDFAQLKQVIHFAIPIVEENTSLNTPLKYILNA